MSQPVAAKAEIVRLQPKPEGQRAVVDFLMDHPYFSQPELASWRILAAEDSAEVVLVLEWIDDAAPQRAIASTHGQDMLNGLAELLAVAPRLAYYRPTS